MNSIDRNSSYKAVRARDHRFDGRFFTGVQTTGIYCRPICPAKIPLLKNIIFYRTAAEAEEHGLRPCKRCRPESAAGSPEWVGSFAIVSRALKLIHEGYLNHQSVDSLANILKVGDRYLRDLFSKHLGISPIAVDISRRLDFARNLIDQSDLKIIEVAFNSGFSSLRRFNDAFKKRYEISPSQIRKNQGSKKSKSTQPVILELAYRPPYDWKSILWFLKKRMMIGVESIEHETYQRTFELGESKGWFEVNNDDKACRLRIKIHTTKPLHLMEIANRIKRMFDLDADPLAIQKVIEKPKALKSITKKYPGLRIPGAWDGFEVAVRAIIGQLVSISAASTISSRLIEKFGENILFEEKSGKKETSMQSKKLYKTFPLPKTLIKSNMAKIGISKTKEYAIKEVAKIATEDRMFFNQISDVDRFKERLLKIKGIGSWTVEYLLLRLSESDAFPATDLIIRKQLTESRDTRLAENCRPWRAYAALYLWRKNEENN